VQQLNEIHRPSNPAVVDGDPFAQAGQPATSSSSCIEGRPVAPTNHWQTAGIAQGASMLSGSSRQRESHGQTRSDMWKNLEDSRGCSCGIALDGHVGHAYNEEALHYFLHIERKRGESSTRPPWLAVVELKTPSGIDVRIDAGLAGKLFAIMATCLRETDFMGWYRADGAVAAVLPQRAGAPRDVAPVVGERIAEALRARLPAEAGRLRVRVFQLPQGLDQ
jgi:hypothetical protein